MQDEKQVARENVTVASWRWVGGAEDEDEDAESSGRVPAFRDAPSAVEVIRFKHGLSILGEPYCTDESMGL